MGGKTKKKKKKIDMDGTEEEGKVEPVGGDFIQHTRGGGGRVVAYLVRFGSDRVGRVFGDQLVWRPSFRPLPSPPPKLLFFCFLNFYLLRVLDLRAVSEGTS